MTSTATPSAPPIVGEGGELAADGLCTVDPCGRKPVAIIGGTGYVGRLLARRLLSHPTFCLGPIVGSSMSEGLLYRDVWERKEHALVKNYGTQLWSALDFPPELEGVRVSSLDALLGTAAHVENRGTEPGPGQPHAGFGHPTATSQPREPRLASAELALIPTPSQAATCAPWRSRASRPTSATSRTSWSRAASRSSRSRRTSGWTT